MYWFTAAVRPSPSSLSRVLPVAQALWDVPSRRWPSLAELAAVDAAVHALVADAAAQRRGQAGLQTAVTTALPLLLRRRRLLVLHATLRRVVAALLLIAGASTVRLYEEEEESIISMDKTQRAVQALRTHILGVLGIASSLRRWAAVMLRRRALIVVALGRHGDGQIEVEASFRIAVMMSSVLANWR